MEGLESMALSLTVLSMLIVKFFVSRKHACGANDHFPTGTRCYTQQARTYCSRSNLFQACFSYSFVLALRFALSNKHVKSMPLFRA
jgi:hypothetical protein